MATRSECARAGAVNQDEHADQLESTLAALTPATQKILAGVGAGDSELTRTLLESMPASTAGVRRQRGVLSEEGGLTDFGAEVTNLLAFQSGLAAAPAVREEVEQLLLARMSHLEGKGRRARS